MKVSFRGTTMQFEINCLILLILTLISLSENILDGRHSLFATKTPFKYHAPQNEWLSPRVFDVIHSRIDKSCRILQVNTLFRHGIRNPGPKDVIRAEKFFLMIKDKLKPEIGFRELPNWTSRFPLSLTKELSESGAKEVSHFGKEYAKLFSTLGPHNILFIASSTNRTRGSCSSFRDGFLEMTKTLDDQEKSSITCTVQNDTLRFFDECKKYLKMVEKGYKEYKMFQNGEEMRNILSNFEKRWNLNVSDVTYNELKAAYATAGTELSTFGTTAWLELFTEEDLEVMEYASDLKGYWKKGYGHQINFEQSCILLKDIFRQLDAAVTNHSGNHHQAVFRFGHSETLLPLLCLLGLYKDDVPLRADNFAQQKNRQFKAGFLSPFTANLDFVILKCDSNPQTLDENNNFPETAGDIKIMLLHNERPVAFPCCSGEVVCPYQVVRDYYSQWIDGCNFDQLCNNGEGVQQSKVEL